MKKAAKRLRMYLAVGAVCLVMWGCDRTQPTKEQDSHVNGLRSAAEQGNANAQNNLGACYMSGQGVPRNYTEAAKWFRKAAEQGHREAQFNLAVCYRNGQGVPRDYTEAAKWCHKAAEQKLANAQYSLAICYESGQGVPQDYTEAAKWFRKAAEQGYELARTNLARAKAGKPYAVARPVVQAVATPASVATANATSATEDNPWTNSLGMKFVQVRGAGVLFCVWETRVKDYRAYARANSGADGSWENPGFTQGEDHPVVNVSWEDAQAFCAWLTKKERAEGKLSASQSYRLPADWKWSVAVGLNESRSGTPKDKDGKIQDEYPWGAQWPPPKEAGNCASSLNVDSYDLTSPVGSFAANKFGICDLGGNVWEWCEDEYSSGSGTRVSRGASWFTGGPDIFLSSFRFIGTPDNRYDRVGFRCVLAVGSSPEGELVGVASTAPAKTKDRVDARHVEETHQATACPASGTATAKTKTVKPPQFPTDFTDHSGTVYRNVRVQRAYPNGILILYAKANGVLDLETISFKELSPELQKYYGYDPEKAVAYEQKERQRRELFQSSTSSNTSQQRWREYYAIVGRRQMEAEQERMQAEQARIEAETAAQVARQQWEDNIKVWTLNAAERTANAAERTAYPIVPVNDNSFQLDQIQRDVERIRQKAVWGW